MKRTVTEETDEPETDGGSTCSQIWTQRRYILTFMLLLGTANMYIIRTNLSVAIVAMTKDTTTKAEFDWDSKQQGLILSSFFYGYMITQLPGGLLAKRFPAHHMYGAAIGIASILTLLTPLATFNFYAIFAVRVLEGLVLGITYPCVMTLMSKWAPPLERSRMIMTCNSGIYYGTVIAMPGSGLLSDYFGWRSVFYVCGIIGLLWYIAWILFIKETPETDKWITEKEKNYILKSLSSTEQHTKGAIPWCAMITSIPFLAVVSAHIAYTWGIYTLITQMPTFLSDTINLKLSANGFLSCLPYLTTGLLSAPAGLLADLLQKRNILTKTHIRKTFICISHILQCSFMLAAAYLMSPVGSVLCLTIAVGISAFELSGFIVNFLDLAPQFSMILFAMSNTFATIPGIVSPMLTGFIVKNKVRHHREWWY